MKYVLIFILLAISVNCFSQKTDSEEYTQAEKYYLEKKYDKAVLILKELATKNHPDATRVLGLCYHYGFGITKDEKKAFECYLKAANLGSIISFTNVGFCYENGEGVMQDYPKAAEWYAKAADKGETQAMINLAYLHLNNKYQEANLKEDMLYHEKQAEKWLREASKAGDKKAMYYLAEFYERMSISDDWQFCEPLMWYKKSAESGYGYAQVVVGIDCLDTKQYDEAIKWFEKAKANGVEKMIAYGYLGDNKDVEIDVLLMICRYLKLHPDLKLEPTTVADNGASNAYTTINNNIMISVTNKENKTINQKLSRTGKLLESKIMPQ